MLRIVEIAFAILFGASSLYFGFKGVVNIWDYYVNFSRLDAHEKVRKARIRAEYFSLSIAGFFAALELAFALFDFALVLVMLVIIGIVWLDYLIFRWGTLKWDRRRPE